MPSVTSKKLPYIAAVQFKESFFEPSSEIGYVYIGRHIAYEDEDSPVEAIDDVQNDREVWENMIAAKKITGNDVELVIPLIDWTGNTKYKQYDDLTDLDTLLKSDDQQVISITANNNAYGVNGYVQFTTNSTSYEPANARIFVNSTGAIVNVTVLNGGVFLNQSTITATPNTGNAVLTVATTTPNLKPMYVFTSQRNVYKCLSNNASANSTVEPFGDYTSSNGNIATTDGYIWKYMFNVKPSNKFLSDEWVPAPSSTGQLDYSVSETGVIDGELTTIYVSNTGSGYYENNVDVVLAFSAGCTILTLANTTNVGANMAVSGIGIAPGTHITNINVPPNQITLSLATTSGGGGGTTANQLSLATRIYVDGNGSGAVASATVNATGQLTKVTVTTIGIGYSRANAFAYGTGTGATLRVIRDMKFGHGKNPARELGANSTMIVSRMGEIDSTEVGKIPANTTFRQYGVFVNPYKYGGTGPVSASNANAVISQATTITVVAGLSYSLGEYVYQGTQSNPSVYGFLIDQDATTARITNVRGKFRTGFPLYGLNSAVERLIVSVQEPEFEPYSGDILYTENDLKTTRTEGQAENIKLIVRF